MAFNISSFSPVGGQSRRGIAPQVFSYKTTDDINTVTASNYFARLAGSGNRGLENLSKGDVIIVTSGVAVKIAGTTTYEDLQHTSAGAGDNTLTHISDEVREFKVRAEATIDGGPNDEIELVLRHWDDSAGAYVDIDSRARVISNVLGGLDVAYFNFEDTVELDQNDRVELWGKNNTDTSNFVALADTTLTLEER